MSYFSQLAHQRQSIRKYSGEEIDPDVLTDIVESALQAPTSRNSRSVRLIVVDDQLMIEALSKVRKSGSAFIAGASVVIAVCADTTVTKRPLADTAIAASYLQLAATSNGLGSCWCHIETTDGVTCETAEQSVHRLLSLPEHYLCHCLIAIGVPKSPDLLEPKERESVWEHVFVGQYDPERDTHPAEEEKEEK
jgi:nitroreductase